MRADFLLFATSLTAAGLLSSNARAAERILTVEQAVEIAMQSNPHLLALKDNVRGGHDVARSAEARMLPSVHVSNEYQHWDSDFTIAFGPTNFTVRDQDTNSFVAAVDQPLLGLFHLSHDYSAQARAAEAGEAQYLAARAELKEAVEVGYLRLFEAKALEDIARASEAELAEEVQVTKARLDAGVLTNADLLRVQVAVANAKQQEILAHTQGQVARANLLGALGAPADGGDIQFAEPKTLLARARGALPALGDAQRQALTARPEVKQRHLQVESADHEHSARLLSLLPEVNAEGAYSRLDGQPFQPQNAAFVGVKLQWPIWEWGASWYAQRAAGERVHAAQHELESEGRQIGVEVASDLAQAQAATSAVDVAEQTIASAEEAFRVTGALLKAGSATTTDLLDSQSALTQARLYLTRAQYEQAIAQVALAKSVGR
jgi:outer membrane protein